MQKNKVLLKFIFLLLFVFIIGGVFTALEQLKFFENDMIINSNEIEIFNKQSFPSFLTVSLEDSIVESSSSSQKDFYHSSIDLNLFGFFKIKTVDVNVANTDLILCGNTVGVYLENNGVTIVGFGGVKNGDNIIYPFENTKIKVGDVIKSINNTKVYSTKDIDNILENKNYKGEQLSIQYESGSKLFTENFYPVYDTSSKSYKLGLWIRENATGIGTLTYITDHNNRFGALGHGITENGQKTPMQVSGGSLHDCEVLGLNKGKRGDPGEIKAVFVAGNKEEGVIDKNNEYGVFGTVKDNTFLKNGKKMEIGGRLSAKPGKAYIYCQLDDDSIKAYEIEIIKTNYQTRSAQKSMVLRVTDKNLLQKTGGIIQGMSGSPIVQDGKIIGAVTHVFVNDPTKGFGLYLDWMLNQ